MFWHLLTFNHEQHSYIFLHMVSLKYNITITLLNISDTFDTSDPVQQPPLFGIKTNCLAGSFVSVLLILFAFTTQLNLPSRFSNKTKIRTFGEIVQCWKRKLLLGSRPPRAHHIHLYVLLLLKLTRWDSAHLCYEPRVPHPHCPPIPQVLTLKIIVWV